MLANLVQQNVAAGGIGNITLGAVSGLAYKTASSVMPLGVEFRGSFTDGNDSEIGIYKLLTADTLERVYIQETVVAGAHTRLNPTALDLSTSATFQIVFDASTFMETSQALPYQAASGAVGRGSFGQNDLTATSLSIGTFRQMFPYFVHKAGYFSSATVISTAAIGGAVGRIFAYQVKHDTGGPGVPFGEFTSSAEVDLSTTGIKTAVTASPFYLPGGEIFVCVQSSAAPVSLRANGKPQATWLGFNAAGSAIGSLSRSDAYANIGGDESASAWNEHTANVSVILRDI